MLRLAAGINSLLLPTCILCVFLLLASCMEITLLRAVGYLCKRKFVSRVEISAVNAMLLLATYSIWTDSPVDIFVIWIRHANVMQKCVCCADYTILLLTTCSTCGWWVMTAECNWVVFTIMPLCNSVLSGVSSISFAIWRYQNIV